ncbi:MAG: hypothetical protein MUF18_04415 [Fimbriiglobus sp.]|nr:hypothetical protein [Fimbriiglobus sp.]
MLDDVVTLLAAAERQADRVADLCRSGQPVDNEVGELSATVARVMAAVPNGVPPECAQRWLTLAERVAAATNAAEAQMAELAKRLDRQALHDRARRAYARPPA